MKSLAEALANVLVDIDRRRPRPPAWSLEEYNALVAGLARGDSDAAIAAAIERQESAVRYRRLVVLRLLRPRGGARPRRKTVGLSVRQRAG